MFPLDAELLLFLKFFVVFTCFFFWVRLGVKALMRNHRIDAHRHRDDDED